MDALTTTVAKLSLLDAECILTRLTKPGSEFQSEVRSKDADTPIAIVRTPQHRIVAWAATHEWRGMQTLEGFTDPDCRRRGYARVAASMLVADGHIECNRTLAVFSPLCVDIAVASGCRHVRLFERRGEDWVENS